MFDMAINSPTRTQSAVRVPAGPQVKAAPKQTPNLDVIDLSKPPTPEQAERLRNSGILGYGSVSAQKTVTEFPLSHSASVIRFTSDYQAEYFDLIHRATVRTSSTGSGVFFTGGSAFASTTTQTAVSWEDGSRFSATFHASAFQLKLSGCNSYYTPPTLQEDGSWSLAEYGPSSQFTISGYHSVLSAVLSAGGQELLSRSETSAVKVEAIIPSGQRPAGAVDMSDMLSQRGELLDQIDKYAGQLHRGFDTHA